MDQEKEQIIAQKDTVIEELKQKLKVLERQKTQLELDNIKIQGDSSNYTTRMSLED